ncbi:hypothetical protein [Xanthocytophaga agilis]|uniref:Uncharacterized protein n=1 Tax=Xanthocytophaga agilis TaxID=3048010 RepID=A0AAE3R428_9BACT|nr:hypothetical protein [Xanthocytophaga agilis]MDJ1501207.1 hypothetical protein [Xanthocytophaga agilis]
MQKVIKDLVPFLQLNRYKDSLVIDFESKLYSFEEFENVWGDYDALS